MPLSPGTEIDRYVIVRLLGSGGMGEVYEARDVRLQRRVALKLLHVENDEEGGAVSEGTSRLLREARLAAALEHPNVVAVYDAGEVDRPIDLKGAMYLAMELIAGTSLRSYVGDKGVPPDQRIRWLVDVARALGAAHARGMVHRDVKPENIMIREDGVVKVLDFGIAKRTAAGVSNRQGVSTTAKGLVVGTPHYMAPEQMRGERLDGRADQFAWGVTAYELLTGEVPWNPKGDSLQLVAEILSKEVPLVTERNSAVPVAVAAAIHRALSKDREHRFPSMDELIHTIDGREAPAEPSTEGRPSREGISAAPTERFGGSGPAIPALAPAPQSPSNSASMPGVQTPKEGSAGDASSERSARLVRAVLGGLAAIGLLGLGGWFASARLIVASKPASSAPVPAPRDCETSKQCVALHGGAPFVCHKDSGTCAPLESEDCKVFAEPSDPENDRTIWIGTMFPARLMVMARGIELARRDFAATTRGLVANGTVRPLAIVGCDDQESPERVATHLVRDIHVPALIGFGTSNEILDLAPRLFIPNDVAVLDAVGQNPLVTRIPQGNPRLVWRTIYSDSAMASAIARFIPDYVESDLRKRIGKPTRVALIKPRGSGDTFAEALYGELSFNGKSAVANRDAYSQFGYVPDAAVVAPDQKLMSDFLAFAPTVVVYLGGDSFIRDFIEAADGSLHEAPVWITPNELLAEVFHYVGVEESRQRRFFGLVMSPEAEANGRLVAHFNEVFPESPISAASSPNAGYDAFYLLAYASYALGDGPVTGSNLARAFQRLVPPGTTIQVGPSGILDAMTALRDGGTINVEGAVGHLDFDLTTGEAPVDLAIMTVAIDARERASHGVSSRLIFDAAAKRFRGSLKTQ